MNAMINPVVTASATSAAWLLEWGWQAAILLGCVWAGLKIGRVKSPALRHQIWLFALIAVVAMPVLSSVVESLPLYQPKNIALSYAVELPKIVITNNVPDVQTPSPAVSVKPSIKQPIVLSLLFCLWIAGVCVFVLRAVMNGIKVSRLKGNARYTSFTDLDCDECDCEASRRAKVRVALSDEIRSPILLGIINPMIVLPADIAAWASPEERRAMLRHELAHVARRDHYVNLFQTVLGAVFFFHPLVRYACRQLILERELACDDHVVGSGAEAEVYAVSIIKVAERNIAPAGAPRGVHQLALLSARQILERRIEMILNKDRVREMAHHWRYLSLSVALIAAVSLLLISSRAGKIAAQQSIINSDEQILIGMVRQVAEGIPRQLNSGGPSPNPNLEFKDFVGKTGEAMWKTFDGFVRQGLTATRVEVDDFHVKIINDEATVDFLGTIYFKDSVRGGEKSTADRYTVVFIKSNGQWQALPLPPPPPPRPVDSEQKLDAPPPPPPPPPYRMTVESGKPLESLRGHEDGDSVFSLLREGAYANINHDTSFFERVLDAHYVGTGPGGETLNKAEQIAQVKRLDYEVKKFEFDDLRLSGNESWAFATFLGTFHFQQNGQDSTVRLRYTVNFIKSDGQWKIAAIHASRKQ